ncbi:MAG TPA: hypothetical protein VFT31_01405 [Kribbella sp.]|nr:hypothetical protein [Kribbella sp.]
MVKERLLAWPRRRWVAVSVATPVLAVVFLAASTTSLAGVSVVWILLVLIAAVLGAGVLASLLPASGRRLELGCSPCAVMSVLSLLGAAIALHVYGSTLSGPMLAVGATLFGFTQRLAQPSTCEVPQDAAVRARSDKSEG